MVFQLEVYSKVDRLLTGITAQQIGTTAQWYSNKTSLIGNSKNTKSNDTTDNWVGACGCYQLSTSSQVYQDIPFLAGWMTHNSRELRDENGTWNYLETIILMPQFVCKMKCLLMILPSIVNKLRIPILV